MRLPDGPTKRSERCGICASSIPRCALPISRTGSRSAGRKIWPPSRTACEERGCRSDSLEEAAGIQAQQVARQLTPHAAREKDADRRCDLEAGLAKLRGAAVAWAVADNALQIHGGNGYAMEYQISRVLCDARIVNICEGAAEIQAQVIARRLLSE